MSHWSGASGSTPLPPPRRALSAGLPASGPSSPPGAFASARHEIFGARLGAIPIALFRAAPSIAGEATAFRMKRGFADTTVATPTRAFARRTWPPALLIAALAAAGEAFGS